MALSTRRWSTLGALVLFAGLALVLLRDGLRPGQVLISGESLQRSLPWAAVLPAEPLHNRFVGDQPRIYYPYLLEAAAVYRGEADALWTSRGGGGQPFLGNMTSALLHPLTLLAAVVQVEWVPLLQALLVLTLSAQFTFLFLRRLRLSFWSAVAGGLAFGFCGHQVLWLQYALSHTLLALPLCFWAVERLVEDRSRGRVAMLSLGFALLIFGGHPETAFVSAVVACLWALWRLWDPHGRSLVLAAVLLGMALSAIQWLPFLEYGLASHGRFLRDLEAERTAAGVSLGTAVVFVCFALVALALLRSSIERSFVRRAAALCAGIVVLVMARRMGMALSSGVLLLPDLYGSPTGGGSFVGAQDYPGLNAGYVGALMPILMTLGAIVGLGGGFLRFFALGSLLLWGAAFHLPGAEGFVRLLPGMEQMAPTRLLGPVAFLAACGGAMILHELASSGVKRGVLLAVRRSTMTLLLIVCGAAIALRVPVDPHGDRPIIAGVLSPLAGEIHDGTETIPIRFELAAPADELRVMVDGRVLHRGRAAAATAERPHEVLFTAQRSEEGRHRLRIEVERAGRTEVLADQPLAIRRPRQLAPRDVAAIAAALAVVALLCWRPSARMAVLGAVVAGADVLSFGWDYNPSSSVQRLFPPTATVEFLRAQQGPFRIFTEGTILPPDTQFAAGVDHLLSYDNLGYHRTYQWLINVRVDMDAYATYSFSRANVDYGSPRFQALDVRYVLTDTATDLSDVPGFQLVHESETRVWENRANLGRAFVVGRALDLTADDPEVLAAADPGQVALLEDPPPLALGGRGTARVLEHEGSRIRVEAEIEGEALLVLAENRGPGWLVSVNGGPPQATWPCHVAWQAIPLGPGRHDVVFTLDSGAFRWGLWISVVAALLALLLALIPRPRPEALS